MSLRKRASEQISSASTYRAANRWMKFVQSDVALWLLVHAFQRLQIIHSDSLSASLPRYTHVVTSHKMHASPSSLSLSLSRSLISHHEIPRNRTQRGDYALEYLSSFHYVRYIYSCLQCGNITIIITEWLHILMIMYIQANTRRLLTPLHSFISDRSIYPSPRAKWNGIRSDLCYFKADTCNYITFHPFFFCLLPRCFGYRLYEGKVNRPRQEEGRTRAKRKTRGEEKEGERKREREREAASSFEHPKKGNARTPVDLR
ncbi:hypothetical protein PUN28_017115 [Cardiocondyla obscurior]|uniref:Uncharacterized protein n=1 Tax=Cardiocondyla obscurior TaxID=286306 RepID=A0AAW2EM21_9HYME